MTDPAYTDPLVTLYLGDCLDVMRELPDASVDSVVTDPPAGIRFMSKEWDRDRGGRTEWVAWMTEVMKECYRLLKPGGHAVVWAIPRTSHWTAWAVEESGLVIRDCMVHIFASGFPKSHNLPGGLGTALKPASEHWWLARKPLVGTVAANVTRYGTGALNIDGTRIGTEKMGGYEVSAGGMLQPSRQREAGYRPKWDREDRGFVAKEASGRWPSNILLSDPELFDDPTPGVVGSGATTTDGVAVRHRSGGNTFGGDNPKPPMDDLGYGAGGGYSRFFLIPKSDRAERERGLESLALRLHRERGECDKLRAWESQGQSRNDQTDSTSPARAISDAQAPEAATSSSATSSPGKPPTDPSPRATRSTTSTGTSRTTTSETSSSLTPLPTSESTPAASLWTESGGSPALSASSSDPSSPSGGTSQRKAGPSTGAADPATSARWSSRNACADCGKPLPRGSSHPTVKPIDLMRHLVRLVTPPGGTCLDPFLGSGTTALAASEEGFRCIGIEREAEYLEIAKGRLMATPMGLGLNVEAPSKPRKTTGRQGPDTWTRKSPKHQGVYQSWWGDPDEEPAA